MREYLHSYLVYGGTALVGILLLWILVDGLHLPIWFAQALAIMTTVVLSYLGHSCFNLRHRSPLDRLD